MLRTTKYTRPGRTGQHLVLLALMFLAASVQAADVAVTDISFSSKPGSIFEIRLDFDGTPPEPGQGRGQGGFGDPSERIAAFLDVDPADPEVAAALDTCGPILDTALSQAGRGNG